MIKALITIIGAVVVLLVLLRLMETRLVFFPTKYPDGFWQPELFGVQAQDCFFETEDGIRLHAWFVPNDNASATLLWCHGNAGNLSHRVDNIARLLDLPINVFIFDYRGYGKSAGKPSEAGAYRDALAAYDYLVSRPEVAAEQVIIFGRSLGGAIAVDLASKRACRALILESTFTSARDVAQASFGFLPIRWVMKTNLDAASKIQSIHVPLLMLHGNRDSVIPFKLGRELFELANEPKEFYEIPGADHNDTYVVGGEAYFARLRQFIEASAQP